MTDNPMSHARWMEIESKLQRAKPRLLTAGCITRRRLSSSSKAFVLRYRERVQGKTVHRSIYLGSQPLANKARALLSQWRAEKRKHQDWWRLYNRTASCRRYSKRARQRLKKAALESFKDPREAVKFAAGFGQDYPLIHYGKPPGRPSRSGLW